ncbi:MAG TPA: Glu/Leu/Phe/Val dehydrogenase dimerization domain-containing protein [Thermoanaerobaculia bacterium]|nr:Glu/Leu/Phe/Val dehydrogenase dimerization domain-containing protein [Thermoanaerobaculia bacterium]
MELFHQMTSMGHEQVLFCSNPDVGLQAIIAVHSTVLGPGLGGVRMWPYASMDEALTDVLRLSRGMTYKAAAAGLNLGGGKAVIVGDAKKAKSEALFRAFGQAVGSLGGMYITAEDVGTDMEDMELIFSETRWVTGISPAHGGGGDPSPVTAYGVFQGIKAAAHRQFGDAALAGRCVAIQGLGNVGYHLAGYLKEEGVKIIGADLHADSAGRAAADHGVEIVSAADILTVECDILAPCALGASLNDKTIPELRCTVVAGGANNQLADEERHGRELHERGILYAPDFVINAGGLINVYTELMSTYNRERALRLTRGIYLNLMRVFEISRTESIPTAQAAERVAEERIRKMAGLRPQHWDRLIRQRRTRS